MLEKDRQTWVASVNKAIRDVRRKPADLEAAKALVALAIEDEAVQYRRERGMFEAGGATFQELVAKSIGIVVSNAVLKGKLNVTRLLEMTEVKL